MMCVDTMLLELVDNGLLRPEKINVTVPGSIALMVRGVFTVNDESKN